jgi:hypothetical protein
MATAKLSPRKMRAIDALLSQPSVKAAAEIAHVGYRTLKRWLREDKAFTGELARLEREALEQTLFRLASASGEALSVARLVMLSPGEISLRLRAADMILGKLLPLRESELERRLVDVEYLLRDMKGDDPDGKS